MDDVERGQPATQPFEFGSPGEALLLVVAIGAFIVFAPLWMVLGLGGSILSTFCLAIAQIGIVLFSAVQWHMVRRIVGGSAFRRSLGLYNPFGEVARTQRLVIRPRTIVTAWRVVAGDRAAALRSVGACWRWVWPWLVAATPVLTWQWWWSFSAK